MITHNCNTEFKEGSVYITWESMKPPITFKIPQSDLENINSISKWEKNLIKLKLYSKEEANVKIIKLFNKVRKCYQEHSDWKEENEEVIPQITERILEEYKIKTIFGKRNEEMWIYQKGVWKQSGREIVKVRTEEILNDECKNHLVNEIVEKVKRQTAISSESFNHLPEGIICLKNGILNLKKQEFSEHTAKYYFKTMIPINYNPKKDCPKIKRFLTETFYPEHMKVIQEWIGFQLYNVYFIKKAVILFGTRDVGKTIFLKLLISFVGEENITGLPLHRITSNDKFAVASLKDKYSNTYDDLSSKDVIDGGGFKIATGGGFITAEIKFGDTFQFKTFAKHTFACNKIPGNQDVDDDAYYSRWIPLPLDNQVTDDDKDEFLSNKITTEDELSGLLNWGLIGLKRLLENGKFSYDKTPEEIKEIMTKHSDALIAFAKEILIKSESYRVNKEDLYELYGIYCEAMNLSRLSLAQVSRRLPKCITFINAGQDSKRFWRGAMVNWEYYASITKDTLDTLPYFKGIGVKSIKKRIDYIRKRVKEIKNKIDNYNFCGNRGIDVKVSKVSNDEEAKIDAFLEKDGVS